jgi:hypothetical protein
LQDLRKSLYVKAKAESTWRFWGLYIHVCKMETLEEAYQMAKSDNGAPVTDGVTFEAIEESGAESFMRQIRDELVTHVYRAMRARKKEIPKGGGKVRVLSIPAIRDRVVQVYGNLPGQVAVRTTRRESSHQNKWFPRKVFYNRSPPIDDLAAGASKGPLGGEESDSARCRCSLNG